MSDHCIMSRAIHYGNSKILQLDKLSGGRKASFDEMAKMERPLSTTLTKMDVTLCFIFIATHLAHELQLIFLEKV